MITRHAQVSVNKVFTGRIKFFSKNAPFKMVRKTIIIIIVVVVVIIIIIIIIHLCIVNLNAQ